MFLTVRKGLGLRRAGPWPKALAKPKPSSDGIHAGDSRC